jgi:predicted exporter
VKTNITGRTDPFWLLAKGETQQAVAANLARIENQLVTAREAGVISSFDLPTSLFPNLENEIANRLLLDPIFKNVDQIRAVLLANGFDETSWALAGHVFAVWGKALESKPPFLPASNLSHWVLDRTISIKPGMALALGAIEPVARGAEWQRLKQEIQSQGGLIAGWDELGHDLFGRVRGRVPLVLGAIVLLSIICLWKAFGSLREVLLGVLTLLFALWCLLAVMKLANWSWNLMNMVAVPLLIGAGVDYTIHVQLALKRELGSLLEMWRKVGRALLLSAGTTIAGFGSLTWAGNAGLASLGMICAIGLTLICFTSVWLLPVWWLAFAGKGAPARE